MWPTMYCENVIQFREMFAAAAKSHCYTLRHAIWKKPPNSLYNHSVQDKSCLVLIPRSSCSQSTSTMHFIADEPISCGSGIVKTKPQKYVHVEMMFIQQDYQQPAREERKQAFEVILAKYTKIQLLSECKFKCSSICMDYPLKTDPRGHKEKN